MVNARKMRGASLPHAEEAIFYSATELAKRWATSAKSIRQWFREGKISGVKLPGGHQVRFPKAYVEKKEREWEVAEQQRRKEKLAKGALAAAVGMGATRGGFGDGGETWDGGAEGEGVKG